MKFLNYLKLYEISVIKNTAGPIIIKTFINAVNINIIQQRKNTKWILIQKLETANEIKWKSCYLDKTILIKTVMHNFLHDIN